MHPDTMGCAASSQAPWEQGEGMHPGTRKRNVVLGVPLAPQTDSLMCHRALQRQMI